jgi:hypothetical protein
MKEWEARGLVHAEMGLDWTSVCVSYMRLSRARANEQSQLDSECV